MFIILYFSSLHCSNAIKVAPIYLGYSFSKYETYDFIQDGSVCGDSARVVITKPVDFVNASQFKVIFENQLPRHSDCKWNKQFDNRFLDDTITSKYEPSIIKNTLFGYATCITLALKYWTITRLHKPFLFS